MDEMIKLINKINEFLGDKGYNVEFPEITHEHKGQLLYDEEYDIHFYKSWFGRNQYGKQHGVYYFEIPNSGEKQLYLSCYYEER